MSAALSLVPTPLLCTADILKYQSFFNSCVKKMVMPGGAVSVYSLLALQVGCDEAVKLYILCCDATDSGVGLDSRSEDVTPLISRCACVLVPLRKVLCHTHE